MGGGRRDATRKPPKGENRNVPLLATRVGNLDVQRNSNTGKFIQRRHPERQGQASSSCLVHAAGKIHPTRNVSELTGGGCRRLAGDGGLEGAALLQPARPAHSARRARQAARLLRQPLAARLAIAHRPTAVARAGHGQLQAGWRPCAREKPRVACAPVIWRVFGTSPCRARGGMVADCGERAGRARRASERVTDK